MTRLAMRSNVHGSSGRTVFATMICVACVATWVSGRAIGADRSIDGTGNNTTNTTWGAAGTQLLRWAADDYGDGVSTPGGSTRPGAREISNSVAAQAGSIENPYGLTSFVWQWGQFVDHDIDLTGGASPAEPFPIDVPLGDPDFDPFFTGTQTIGLSRSVYDTSTGLGVGNPRQQVNEITAFIDASNVYGSDTARATALRTLSGGKLKTSAGNLLPYNTLGLPNANEGPVPDNQLFLAGDVRANEQIGLTAMHTLFVREHNRLADEIATENPGWSDELIYQRARKTVGAQMQVITYSEFLPMMLGPGTIDPYSGYDSLVDPGIRNEFSTALYRLGHSMLPTELLRIETDGTTAAGGPVDLAGAFFNPGHFSDPMELERILEGLSTQIQQDIDNQIVDDVRNFLFGPPGAGGFDLASLNIQRGRDHGLADYNSARVALGLPAASSFADITTDISLQNALALLYGDVNDVDLWVGALAEDHIAGGAVGELIAAGLKSQFEALRDGDRFWYENDSAFTEAEKLELAGTRLADIVMRNTAINDMQLNAFQVVPEPATAWLAVVGVMLLAGVRRRRR